MTIIFICGSLEPGKDGVGDYTRRLAGELSRQGNFVAALALSDSKIEGVMREKQEQEAIVIPVLRIGSNESSQSRFSHAKEWIDQFNPEWLSLQFVPFSFQKKGLPLGLGKQLARIGKGRKWHLMFHELWIGMDKKASYKFRFLGFLQKQIIKGLIDSLAPNVIHTQTGLYRAHLEKLGYKTQLLPLFGNIPVLFQAQQTNKAHINIAVFGGIQSRAKLKEMIGELPKNQTYTFHFIGSNGPEQDRWVDVLKENSISYKLYGWMENKEVSKALSQCQWGLTSTPYYLTEKSGSAAAMLEHNLLVFCIARTWEPRDIETKGLTNPSVVKWKSKLDLEICTANKENISEYTLKRISGNLIKDLVIN